MRIMDNKNVPVVDNLLNNKPTRNITIKMCCQGNLLFMSIDVVEELSAFASHPYLKWRVLT